jgi:hypothetical protein
MAKGEHAWVMTKEAKSQSPADFNTMAMNWLSTGSTGAAVNNTEELCEIVIHTMGSKREFSKFYTQC